MGAFSSICLFDHQHLERVVAPALIARLRAEARATEAEVHRLPARTAELAALEAGLGITAFGACEFVREDLGVQDALLVAARPALAGSCESTRCQELTKCPLHARGQARCSAESLMTFARRWVEASCVSERTVLGKDATWFVVRWLGVEAKALPDDLPAAMRQPVELLLRLFKRGAAIGWADGGFFEGLLGWLSAAEAHQLHATLTTSVGPAIVSALEPSLEADEVPALLAVMNAIALVAQRAAAKGLGVAIVRE